MGSEPLKTRGTGYKIGRLFAIVEKINDLVPLYEYNCDSHNVHDALYRMAWEQPAAAFLIYLPIAERLIYINPEKTRKYAKMLEDIIASISEPLPKYVSILDANWFLDYRCGYGYQRQAIIDDEIVDSQNAA